MTARKKDFDLWRTLAAGDVQLPINSIVENLYGTLLASMIGFAYAAVAMAVVAFPTADSLMWIWLIAIGLTVGIRAVDHLQFQKMSAKKREELAHKLLCRFVIMALLVGGLVLVFTTQFFSDLSVIQRSITMVILVGIASGTASSLGSTPLLSMVVIAMVLAPPAYLLVRINGEDWILAPLALMFFVTLAFMTRRNQLSLISAVNLSESNRRLRDKAVAQQRRMARLNKDLTRAQQSLVKMNQKLENSVYKRTVQLRREIIQREKTQQKLERIASADPLTGLANRIRLSEILKQALDINDRDYLESLAVFFVDLDRFKEINDGLGHPVGDVVLKKAARRLRKSVPNALCMARWGGDEFVVLMPRDIQSGVQEVESAAQRIVERINRTFEIGGNTISLSASVGVSMAPEHGSDPDELILHADMAVYEAKRAGRSTFRVFTHQWQQAAADKIQLISALRDAAANDALKAVYQPILDPSNGQVQSMEALMRWTDPTLGAVSPDIFIPLAEANGMIDELGTWILRQACQDAKQFVGDDCKRVSVNVSAQQLNNPDFVRVVENVLIESELPPEALELELTETVYAKDTDQILTILKTLRDRGVRVAIDDFGTGYSSLAYLQQFPVDVLKVDKSFVSAVETDTAQIVAAITSLAASLDVEVVAEGVETVGQLRAVRQLGASHVQGYLFARPQTLDETVAWLLENRKRTLVTKKPDNADQPQMIS
jgi:diguanylate cyclase (GGDEF)-like protein